MKQATEKLSRLRLSDLDDDDLGTLAKARAQGRKSGTLLLASDLVERKIDWPHLYVRRMVASRRRSVPFADLRVEEFVYGFLCMLEAPNCTLDCPTMLRMLKEMMQDTMDFSWPNVRGFYEIVGLEVEQDTMGWEDEDKVHKYRMAYARTIFPDKKEEKEKEKTTSKGAPPGTKICTAYQTHVCEMSRDHAPHTHACAHCFKTANILHRHAEVDCFKKIAEDTKNAKRRE